MGVLGRTLVLCASLLAVGSAAGQEPASPELRTAFAETLTRETLKMGFDLRASAQDAQKDRLLVLGYPIDRPVLFRLVSYARLLDEAKKKGFHKVEVINMIGPSDRLIFDLSGPGPAPKCSSLGRVFCAE